LNTVGAFPPYSCGQVTYFYTFVKIQSTDFLFGTSRILNRSFLRRDSGHDSASLTQPRDPQTVFFSRFSFLSFFFPCYISNREYSLSSFLVCSSVGRRGRCEEGGGATVCCRFIGGEGGGELIRRWGGGVLAVFVGGGVMFCIVVVCSSEKGAVATVSCFFGGGWWRPERALRSLWRRVVCC
jgi:hypothetical protein